MATRPLASRGPRKLVLRRTVPLQIAPLRLRCVAFLINLLLAIVALALAIGTAGGAFYMLRGTRLGRVWRSHVVPDHRRAVRSSDRDDLSTVAGPLAAKVRSPWVRLALQLSSFAVAVRRNGRQSPGARAVGIRLIDARTGAEPNRWQAVVRVSTGRAWQDATSAFLPWPKVRPLQEDDGFRSELEAAKRKYADDEDALHHELMRIYREHQASPTGVSCLPGYARLLVAAFPYAPALWTPLKQSLPDKFAGTVVTVERRASLRTRLAAKLR